MKACLPHHGFHLSGVQQRGRGGTKIKQFGFSHAGDKTRIDRLLRASAWRGKRYSTVEVSYHSSEAPNLRNSIDYPKTDIRKKKVASRWIIPWPKYTITSFCETRLAFRRFWVKESQFSEIVRADSCYICRRTRSNVALDDESHPVEVSNGFKWNIGACD